MKFSMSSTETNEGFEGPDRDGQDFVLIGHLFILIPLPEQGPHLGQQFDSLISELGVHRVFAVGNVPSEEILLKDFLGFSIRLVNVILLEDNLIVFELMVVRMDYKVLIVSVTIELLVNLGSHSVVAAHSLRYSFVFFGILLVQHDKNQVETRQEGVRHTNVLGGGKLNLILSIDRVSSSDY